jgi:hypothetical protein
MLATPESPSKLMFAESPLMVLPRLAAAIGVNEAIMLQQIHYWLCVAGHERDGRRWIYNSYSDWTAQIPFWSRETVRRVLGRLRARGLVITGNYNRHGFDRTLWYTIDYAALAVVAAEYGLVATMGPEDDVRPPDAAPEGGAAAASGGESAPPGGAAATSGGKSAPQCAPRGGKFAPGYGGGETPYGENGTRGGTHAPPPVAGAIACGDSGTTIPETTTEITSEITSETNTRERERAGAPSPPAYENFTMTETLTGWLAAECATLGVPPTGVNAAHETDKWRDEIRAGRRAVPADAAADWRQWMRRALTYARRHQPEGPTPHVPVSLASRPAQADLDDLAARNAAAAEAFRVQMDRLFGQTAA